MPLSTYTVLALNPCQTGVCSGLTNGLSLNRVNRSKMPSKRLTAAWQTPARSITEYIRNSALSHHYCFKVFCLPVNSTFALALSLFRKLLCSLLKPIYSAHYNLQLNPDLSSIKYCFTDVSDIRYQLCNNHYMGNTTPVTAVPVSESFVFISICSVLCVFELWDAG